MLRRSDDQVEAGPQGPALTGTDHQALVQALRNLWPILDKPSRTKAIGIVKKIQKGTEQ